ncbi:MAG: hypothetical protein M1827_006352 [Pycnora praestabilis]|nr:MAG: hypothetical protein M1827_006352 [Pycnora praestabilis]
MPIPFGFSVGDFIAGIDLIRELIAALNESTGSASEYQAVIHELRSLQSLFKHLESLRLKDDLKAQGQAVGEEVRACERTIKLFLGRVAGYDPFLRKDGSGVKWRDGLWKLKWCRLRREDVERVQMLVQGHVAALQLQISLIQLESSRLDDIANSAVLMRVDGQLQSSITHSVENAKMQKEIYNIIRTIQQQQLQPPIPQQVVRQQPITVEDARGRRYPFHLELINSWEEFEGLLKLKLKDPTSQQKIARGEYIIQDTRTKRDLPRSRAWETCLRPGQCVNMSMVFHREKMSDLLCTACWAKDMVRVRETVGGEKKEIGKAALEACPVCDAWLIRQSNTTTVPSPTTYAINFANAAMAEWKNILEPSIVDTCAEPHIDDPADFMHVQIWLGLASPSLPPEEDKSTNRQISQQPRAVRTGFIDDGGTAEDRVDDDEMEMLRDEEQALSRCWGISASTFLRLKEHLIELEVQLSGDTDRCRAEKFFTLGN